MADFRHTDPYDFTGTHSKIPGMNIGIDNEIDYRFTRNKPKVNGVELVGEKSLEALGIASSDDFSAHESDTGNPHSVTKSQVGLGNVDNTADADKPISTAVSSALSTKYEKPSSGIPKSDLSSYVRASLEKADSALQSFTETDPTVPSWAKQANKPQYTATEVGADPSGSASSVDDKLTSHKNDKENPHSVTKRQVGLGNVDNTSDVNKPVSTAQSAAISQRIPNSEKGVANGVATLDSSGKVPSSQLPTIKSDLKDMTEDAEHRTVSDTEKATWNAKQSAIDDIETIRSGAALGASSLQPGDIADWAKGTTKPSYSASEVNALPSTATVNGLSFTNGSCTIPVGEENKIEVVKVNGTPATISESDKSVNISVPSEVTESTVTGWGFTKNSGTVTKVKVNGDDKTPGSDGVVDIGTVLAALPTIEKSDLSTEVAGLLDKADSALQSEDIPNWAKESNKPSYSLSELSDDSEHRTVTDSEKTEWSGKQGAISDLDTIRSGASAGSSAVQPSAITDMATKTWVGQQGYGTSNLALGETGTTAYAGDKGKTAYDHSQIVSGNPHGVTWANLAGDKPQIPDAQVNSDWNATTGKAAILNKPTTVSGYGITDAQTIGNLVTSISDTNPSDTKYPSEKAVKYALDNKPTDKLLSSDKTKYLNSEGEIYTVGTDGSEDEKTDHLVKDSDYRTSIYEDSNGDVCIEYDDSETDPNLYDRPISVVGSPLVVYVSPATDETAVSFTAELNLDYVFTKDSMAALSDVAATGGGVETPSVAITLPSPTNVTKAHCISFTFDGTSSTADHTVVLSSDKSIVFFASDSGTVPKNKISYMDAKWDGERWIVLWVNSKEYS